MDQINPVAEDILRGVAAIAAFIGLPPRKCYYQLERGYLPAGKAGAEWIASRATLRAHHDRLCSGREVAA